MKTKLIRIFVFLFAVASVTMLAAPIVSADEATDKRAIDIIANCKGIQGPYPTGSNCAQFRECTVDDKSSDLCAAIRALQSRVPGPGSNVVNSCRRDSQQPKEDCISALTTCLSNSAKDSKIPKEDFDKCTKFVEEGKLQEAKEYNKSSEETTSCVIDGLGWIICPVLTLMGQLVDASYAFVETLLTVQPLTVDDANNKESGIYSAWSVMRNIANIAFIIAFLVIVFSQVTSVGVTNYGIKKLLPRLILAAIFVNVSFWVCAIAVDLSNITGAAVKGIFDSVGAGLEKPQEGAFSGGGWLDFVGVFLAGAVATGVIFYVGLSALAPALLIALIAIITVALVLVIRQALIVLLIVVAPLAFVAYLLPNTESWFTKWRKLFWTMLAMFPIIAGMFGAASLASLVVMNSASGEFKIAIQIMGALIAVAPLLLTPLVMKASGNMFGKVSGFMKNNKATKGAENGVGNWRKRQEGRREIRALNGGSVFGRGRFQRRARRNAVSSGIESRVKNAQASYVADEALGSESFQNQLAGGQNLRAVPDSVKQRYLATPEATNQALANAINVQSNIENEEVKAASAIIENASLSSAQQQHLAMGGDLGNGLNGGNTAIRIAAIQRQMKTGTLDEAEKMIMASANTEGSSEEATKAIRRAAAEGMHAGGHVAKATYLGGDMADRVKAGEIKSEDDLNSAAARRIKKGKLSAETLKSQDANALKRLSSTAEAAAAGAQYNVGGAGQQQMETLDPAVLAALKDQAKAIKADQQLARQITREQQPHLDRLDNLP